LFGFSNSQTIQVKSQEFEGKADVTLFETSVRKTQAKYRGAAGGGHPF